MGPRQTVSVCRNAAGEEERREQVGRPDKMPRVVGKGSGKDNHMLGLPGITVQQRNQLLR